jgi:hypothetical protein
MNEIKRPRGHPTGTPSATTLKRLEEMAGPELDALEAQVAAANAEAPRSKVDLTSLESELMLDLAAVRRVRAIQERRNKR